MSFHLNRTQSIQGGPVGQSVSRSEGLNLEAGVTTPRRSLEIRGHLRRPEIVLFDEPTNQNSQCLVLRVRNTTLLCRKRPAILSVIT